MTDPVNEYEIETVADFLDVPEDRLAACLADFQGWLRLARSDQTDGLLRTMLGAHGSFVNDRFLWRDDGKSGITFLNLIDKDTGETMARIDMSAKESAE